MKRSLLLSAMVFILSISCYAQCPLPSVGMTAQYRDTAGSLGLIVASQRCFAYSYGIDSLRDNLGGPYMYDTACILPHDGRKVIRPGHWLGCETVKGGWVRAIPFVKRIETYSGTTVAAGTYTVTFPTPFPTAPDVDAKIVNGTDTQIIRLTAVSTTGFTVLVRNRVDVIGLLPTWSNVSGATVSVVATSRE